MAHLYNEYVNRFQNYYEGIKLISEKHKEVSELKYHHTFRVVNEITNLCKYLKLSDEELFLAKLIALFHDVGRFEQYAQYQTFSDKKSVDHAELALKIIEENNLLSGIGKHDVELIRTAILNHNKFAVADNLSGEQFYFAQLIRDADKLDILYVVTNRKKYFVPDDVKKNHTDINPGFIKNIQNHELVSYDDVKGMLDYVLLRMSWVFDLYFDYSIHQYKERNYFEKMLSQLPETEQKNEIRNSIAGFIEKKTYMLSK